MRSTRSLLAVASGITIVDLWRAMVYPDDTELTIENLEIGYNNIMDYDENDFYYSEFRDTFDVKGYCKFINSSFSLYLRLLLSYRMRALLGNRL
jgi:hypothetical protein